jgi:excinuclease ABC subunit A
VIEHHTAVIAEADYLLEIGPEAGANGGRLVCCGTPEEVAAVDGSRIAPFLKPLLSLEKPKRKTRGAALKEPASKATGRGKSAK